MFEFSKKNFKRGCFTFLLASFLLLTASSCLAPLVPDGLAQISLEVKLAPNGKLSKVGVFSGVTRVLVTVSTGLIDTENYEELVVQRIKRLRPQR